MSEKTVFSPKAWDDYTALQDENKRTLRKINQLIKVIHRNGYAGLGHPEALKGNLAGWWSRTIDEKNRPIYKINSSDDLEILQVKGHYDDK